MPVTETAKQVVFSASLPVCPFWLTFGSFFVLRFYFIFGVTTSLNFRNTAKRRQEDIEATVSSLNLRTEKKARLHSIDEVTMSLDGIEYERDDLIRILNQSLRALGFA